MNTIILIKLITAHLTGDFLLQSDRMCIDKFSNNSKAKYKALVSAVDFEEIFKNFGIENGENGIQNFMTSDGVVSVGIHRPGFLMQGKDIK